jgi:MFS transporter, DHA1 family, quinolone resistance protein
MRKNLQLIALLRSLSTGVISPVLTLMALSHGATLSTMSLAIGAYSFTVIAAEFPSGVFADLFGRKLSFVVSSLFVLAAYALFLISGSFEILLAAMILNGLGRAFASGSIDALAIDEAADDAALVKVTARLSILESVGLAVGALAGGLLAGLGNVYAGNLLACMALVAVMLVLTLFTVHEAPRASSAQEDRPRLGAHLRESLGFLKRRGVVRMLLIFTVLSGLAMLTVETYWQPALAVYQPASWMLGAVNCLGFAAIIVGSKCTEWQLTRAPRFTVALMLGQKALWGASLFGLWLSGGAATFVGSYALGYVFLGGSSVAESTLLNREAPSAQRASILSLFSFLLQLGVLLASLCGYWVVTALGFRALWPLSGGLLIAFVLAFAVYRAFKPQSSH